MFEGVNPAGDRAGAALNQKVVEGDVSSRMAQADLEKRASTFSYVGFGMTHKCVMKALMLGGRQV